MHLIAPAADPAVLVDLVAVEAALAVLLGWL